MGAKKDTYTSALSDKRFWIWVALPVFGHYLWDLIAFSNMPEFLLTIFFIIIQLGFIVLMILLIRVIIQSNLKPKDISQEMVVEEIFESKLGEEVPKE
ncbi:MAG: hypothetical protein PHY42_06505 [Bacilli bacterium]|nr:hypothetical protein [Bacilli bacterium]